MITRLLTLIAIIWFPVVAFATTPTISSVSGTVATGQTLTVSGTTMMDQDTSGWQSNFAWNFEGSNYSADGYLVPAENAANCTVLYDSSVKLMGSKSIQFRVPGAWSGIGVGSCYAYVVKSIGNDFYTSTYFRYDPSAGSGEWPTAELKMLIGTGGAYAYYSQPVMPGTGGPPSQWQARIGGTGENAGIPGGTLIAGRWYHLETHWNNSTKLYETWIDGVKIHNITSFTADTAPLYLAFGMINQQTTTTSYDMNLNMERFVLSTSRIYPASKIEIGDNSDYALAQKVYQPPAFLSDASVQVVADLTGLGAGPYYLFVTNNKQETSAAFPLSGDVAPPSLSSLGPSGESAQATASLNLVVTTDEAATCRYSHGAATTWGNMIEFGTTGSTSHSQSVAVWPGLVRQSCYKCRDASLNESDASCTTYWVEPEVKQPVRH